MTRDKSIDAMRGLAITLVVVGHSINVAAAVFADGPGLVPLGGNTWVPAATAHNVLLSVAYSFHMPLMAFVSGLVMWPPRDQPLGTQLLRRARSLLVPYFVWAVLLYLLLREVGPPMSGGFGDAMVDALLGRSVRGLWYLYALFICIAVLLMLIRIPGSRWTVPTSAVLAVIGSSGLFFSVPNVLYLTGGVLWIYPFVVVGYLSASLRARAGGGRRRWLVPLAGTAAYVPLFLLRYPVFGGDGTNRLEQFAVWMHDAGLPGGYTLYSALRPVLYTANLLPYACALAAIVAMDALYVGRAGKAIDIQAWVGRRSLGIYALHGAVLWWAAWAGIRNAWLLFAVAFGVSAGLTALLERIPVLDVLLFGQRGKSCG